MIVVIVFLLLKCVDAQIPPVYFGQSKKMTPEQFRAIPDDPFSDPADDIPPVPPNARPGDTPASVSKNPQSLLPRDRYMEEGKSTGNQMSPRQSKDRATMWIDFQQLHDKLIQEQARPDYKMRAPHKGFSPEPTSVRERLLQEKLAEFKPHGFGLKSDDFFRNTKLKTYKPIVWTTCDDFKKGSRNYNPEDIINIVWIPFYTWSSEMEVQAMVHTFDIPTKRQVYSYHTKLSPYLNRSIDWNQPKLHFDRDHGSQKALLIAVDRTGLYYFIMDMEVPEYVQRNKIIIPIITVRLKIIKEYLAMMYCEHNYAAIMARDGLVPPTNKEKRETAKVLGFRGKGRPVIRDIQNEQMRKEMIQQREMERKAMKYLPSAPGAGYFDNVPMLGERPIGPRNKNKNAKY